MNISAAIRHIYPAFEDNTHFVIVQNENEESTISEWKNNLQKPTEAELQAAWDELQANPPAVPQSETELLRQEIAEERTRRIQLHDDLRSELDDAILELSMAISFGGM